MPGGALSGKARSTCRTFPKEERVLNQVSEGGPLSGIKVDAAAPSPFALDSDNPRPGAALDIFEQPDISIDFDFQPGEIQFVDNRTLGHSRTEFEDYPEPEQRRHLVRLWLRDYGRRAYTG